ncbi:phytanoyl-CoA dioxygenase family protein [Parvibaculum sp.]|uniref:phytanoyl-CoA dioxygenase family protein n=1 Tax=Parvibaculum sp. TaxID=2024848 RepID=UPI002C3C2067|nr:phytanoyl-CoA dioxygenase family protein [Parvibaculum sp.]HUD50140.1 phytanoyl-CoA dioxygenase family protein [Parvibaculum sp.]
MLTEDQSKAWERDGFFVIRGYADPEIGLRMEREVVDAIRREPPELHQGEVGYVAEGTLLIQPEAKSMTRTGHPEDLISKIFNPHLSGTAKEFAFGEGAADIVSDLLGPDIDIFQSQFIFKNPGAWGQPWHQDSFYFPFDQQPQVGLWLAISEATLENGCLSVLPGSHREPVHAHVPDGRLGANQGYQEIVDHDMSGAVPMLMQPGDLLVFHSFLMHRSEDNRSSSRRSAMVYHYGRAGTKMLRELSLAQNFINRWMPVRRAA